MLLARLLRVASDTVAITAVGAIALNTNAAGAGTDQVEFVTLSGNGAAVTYTLNAGDALENVTVTGSQNVTLVATAAQMATETMTTTNTGVTTLQISDDATADLSNVAAAIVVDVNDTGTGGTTVTLANEGNAKVSANGTIAFNSTALTTETRQLHLKSLSMVAVLQSL